MLLKILSVFLNYIMFRQDLQGGFPPFFLGKL